jgi:precorrin-8X/cobalt-precorrin-8 methylmutase
MEWQVTDLQNLALIDRELGDTAFAPAEYEILRRVIYETVDCDYQSLIRFSEGVLQASAIALANQAPIIVDVPMVMAGIAPTLYPTFANPVYCSLDVIPASPSNDPPIVVGIQTLARNHPQGIFVIGQSHPALTALVELIEEEEIQPALVIGTPAGFLGADVAKARLRDSLIPHITINGRKGNAIVAVTIFNALVDLAWLVYQEHEQSPGAPKAPIGD